MLIMAEPGESIYRASERVCLMATVNNREYTLRFNDIDIRVYAGSHEYDINEKYWLLRKLAEG